MKDTMIFQKLAAALTAIVLCVVFAGSASAARPSETVDTSGRFRFDIGGVFGRGFSREYVADREDNTPIFIRAGGGAGIAATLGYGLSSRFDLDISAVRQISENKNNAINGGMEFKKVYALGTLKYKFPFKSKLDFYGGQIKIGAGIGLYMDTNLTVTHNNMSTDLHSEYFVDYEPALGYHTTVEFETFMPNDWALSIGARIYFVDFKADSTQSTGIFKGNNAIIDKSSFDEMDGSGVDLLISLGKYFW